MSKQEFMTLPTTFLTFLHFQGYINQLETIPKDSNLSINIDLYKSAEKIPSGLGDLFKRTKVLKLRNIYFILLKSILQS